MFLKRCARKKNGKPHTYWQLVESYRTPRGPRHRVVAYLGELGASEHRGWGRLALHLDGKAAVKAQQLMLFDTIDTHDNDPVPQYVEVDLKGVRVERTRDFGDVFLALTLWRMLGFDELFSKNLPVGREEVSWSLMACVLTIARFVEPDSELHVEDTWYHRTALGQMLAVAAGKVNSARLYRTLDTILPLKSDIETHLKQRVGELFSPDFDLLLYDVTSTYFEGQAKANPQAKHGYSRDHRGDCKQVCIGLVATQDGFPLAYEVFSGNRADVTTVKEMVEIMESKYGRARRIWVMDRGMVSEDNLQFLRNRGGFYLVGTPRGMLKRFEAYLLDSDWSKVQEGIEVKLVNSPNGQETFVLCRSADRREKEKAIHERFAERIEAGLSKLDKEIKRARKKRDRSVLERRIGRLLGKNSRAAGGFKIEVVEDKTCPAGLQLHWWRIEAWRQWSSLSEGCYLLRTNLTEQSPEKLWQTYMQLTDVEAVFRTGKSDLKIRPIWHQLEHRVQGHILFSFLAYALWKTLQIWMERSGLGRGVRTVIEEFARLKANDVILKTSAGREIKLCCITQPDPAQRALLDRMGLMIPERLGRPLWVRKPKNLTEM
ncbi:IS1634 family transposase ISVsp2 [subsurface metagenome]